jgi:phospholipid:diacylglycerol acyltransferase
MGRYWTFAVLVQTYLIPAHGFGSSPMASPLRRRIIDGDTPSDSRESIPDKAEEARLVPESKIHNTKRHDQKRQRRRHWFVFLLGGLAGIFAAGLFAKSNDLIEFPELGAMDSLLDVLPANVIQDARDLIVSITFRFPNARISS